MTESKLVKMKAFHLLHIAKTEPKYAYMIPILESEIASFWESLPHAYTYLVNEEPVACLGLREYWPGRAEAWAFFIPKAGKHFTGIHRVAKAFLKDPPVRRIEAAVAVDFERGHRWVKLLGFRMEAQYMESFFNDGRDAALYARVHRG